MSGALVIKNARQAQFKKSNCCMTAREEMPQMHKKVAQPNKEKD